MTSKEIKAKVDRSSLGTKSAMAARRSVPNVKSRQIVARAERHWANKKSAARKSGG